MNPNQKIPVEKVTKPIQLLAAWLTGLILVDGIFLAAATTVETPAWATGTLVVASVLNVPIFLYAIFLLQTKFRPEMQEDSFYAKYLESKTGTIKQPVSSNQLNKLKEELFLTNTETLDIVSDLQSELKKIAEGIDGSNENSTMEKIATDELDKKIKSASDSSSWNQYSIRINKYLKEFNRFKLSLVKNNIPIHNTIGTTSLTLNDPPEILIGSGFSMEHIKQFLNAISDLPVAIIGFAEDEEEDYYKEILLGAYNTNHGISLEDAIEIANQDTIDPEVFYSALQH